MPNANNPAPIICKSPFPDSKHVAARIVNPNKIAVFPTTSAVFLTFDLYSLISSTARPPRVVA